MKNLVRSGDLTVDLASAFDASPNPYVLLTPDLKIAGLNQAYLDVTNSTRDDILGQPLFGAFDSGPSADAPENVRQVKASLEKARETRQRDHHEGDDEQGFQLHPAILDGAPRPPKTRKLASARNRTQG